MKKMRKVTALVLSLVMALSLCVTAFADNATPTNLGSLEGTGTPEGHLDKKVMNVTLPTVSENASTFNYTMDPERLVSATSAQKYGADVIFPTTGDTGVYFNNGLDTNNKTVYANSSKALNVVNKSSHDIKLTVKAEAVATSTDIPLVGKAQLASATDAALYLGLKVGSATPTDITTSAAATAEVTLQGMPSFFKTAVESNSYVYRVLTLTEWQALSSENSSKQQADYDAAWQSTSIQLEGAVNQKTISKTTSAPKVKVTWSWTDPSDGISLAGGTTITYSNTTSPVVLTFNGAAGVGIASITFVNNGDNTTLGTNRYSYDSASGKLTLTGDYIGVVDQYGGKNRSHTITFNDNAKTKITFVVKAAG